MTACLNWRSLLFAPANNLKLVAKATALAVDAVILDLEDSVLADAKIDARANLAEGVKRLDEASIGAVVRVNREETWFRDDLRAAFEAGAQAVIVPKANNATDIGNAAEILDEFTGRTSGDEPGLRIIALIESVHALPQLDSIAQAHPRLVGLMLGSEDYAKEMSVPPTGKLLEPVVHLIAQTSVRHGLLPIGLAGSLANFSDLALYEETALSAKAMGMKAAAMIHPKQVPIINRVFGISQDEADRALDIITAFEAGLKDGKGVIAVDGMMVDAPVYERAKDILERFARQSPL